MIMQDKMVNELGGCLDGHTFSWGMEQLGQHSREAVKAPISLLVILVSSIIFLHKGCG